MSMAGKAPRFSRESHDSQLPTTVVLYFSIVTVCAVHLSLRRAPVTVTTSRPSARLGMASQGTAAQVGIPLDHGQWRTAPTLARSRNSTRSRNLRSVCLEISSLYSASDLPLPVRPRKPNLALMSGHLTSRWNFRPKHSGQQTETPS